MSETGSRMLTDVDSPQLRPNAASRVPWPLVGGVLFGFVLLLIWYQLEPKWAFYIFLGTVAAASLPVLAVLIRGVDRFFLWCFLLSQQLFLSFQPLANDYPMPGGAQGFCVTLQFVLAVAYLVAWRTRTTVDPEDVRAVHPKFRSACFWFLGLASLSLLTSSTKIFTLYGLFYHFGLIVTALAACHICSSRAGIKALWSAIWVITVVQCLVLLVQRVVQVSFSLTGEVIDSQWVGRWGGTMGVAPVSSATLLMGLVLFCELRLLRGDKRTLYSWAPAFGLGFLCLLLSLTRSAWIGTAIGSVFLIGWIMRRGGLSTRRGIVLAAAAFVGLVLAYGPVRDRLDANHQAAADERFRLNYINYEMIKAHPVIGIGLNTAYDSRKRYLPSFFDEDEWIYIAHNQYLLIAAEAGLVGLIAFLRILWLSIKGASAAARSKDVLIGETGAVLFAYLLGFVWGMNLDFYGGMQVYVVYWFTLGCAVGVQLLAQREATVPTSAVTAISRD